MCKLDWEDYELELLFSCDTIVPLIYDRQTKLVYNSCGREIVNVFAHITPNDLLLYQRYPEKYHLFRDRSKPRVLCSMKDADDAFAATQGFPPCSKETQMLCWATMDERDAYDFEDLPCNLCQGQYH